MYASSIVPEYAPYHAESVVAASRLPPIVLLGLALLLPALRTITPRRFAASVRSPFRILAPFITDEDVQKAKASHPYGGTHQEASGRSPELRAAHARRNAGFERQRRRTSRMAFFALVQSLAWAVYAGWSMTSHLGLNTWSWAECLSHVGIVCCWVYSLHSLVFHPPRTPPYLLLLLFLPLLFSSTVCLFDMCHALLGASAEGQGSSALISAGLQLLDWVLCATQVGHVLAMPIVPGGYEAIVSARQHARLEKGEAVPESESMAETYEVSCAGDGAPRGTDDGLSRAHGSRCGPSLRRGWAGRDIRDGDLASDLLVENASSFIYLASG